MTPYSSELGCNLSPSHDRCHVQRDVSHVTSFLPSMATVFYPSFFTDEQKQLLSDRLEEFAQLRSSGRHGRRNRSLERFLENLEAELLERFGNTEPLVVLENRNNLRRVSTFTT